MASREEWCADKLSKLLNEELRISTLNEIKDHLQSLPSHEVKPTVKYLDLPLMFDCLNNTDNTQIDLACEVLSLCLDNLNIGESASKYGISLERALAHPHIPVKLMVLKELERNVKNDDVLIDLCKRHSLLYSIIQCLGCENLEVASRCSKIVVVIGCSDTGIRKLTSPDSVSAFSEVQATNEVNRLRVFELFVDISKESKSSFRCLDGTGLISPIINDLESNDILLRMNIIEILSQLGQCDHGFDYLETKGVIRKLSQMLKSTDLLDLQLSEPGILKFFGNMGHWKPKEIIGKYPDVIKRMFEHLDGADFSLLGVSLDAVAYIGITSDGKCALDSLGIMHKSITNISIKLATLPTELTIRVLKFLEHILKVDNENSQISTICRKWYFSLGENPMNAIMRYAKNPFSEIRIAGLYVILSISNQIWGQEIIKDTPGLIEFLLDRNAETHKECKEIKYDIIKILSTSSILDPDVVRKLTNYVKEGPFYIQGVMEVAFEGNE